MKRVAVSSRGRRRGARSRRACSSSKPAAQSRTDVDAGRGRRSRRSGCSPTARSRCRRTVLADFTKQTGYKVKLVQPGDAGVMVNEAILRKDNPVADALFGVDNTFLTRALDAGIFDPYTAHGLDIGARRAAGRRATPRDARSTRATCASTTTQSWFGHDGRPPAPTVARRPRRPAVQEPHGGRERGDVVARARVPARHDRGQGRERLAGLLARVEGQRRAGRRRLDRGLRDRLHRGRRERRPADRGVVRIRSRGRRRSFSNPHRDTPNVGVHRVDVLRADGVRRRAARRAQRRRRAGARRLHVDAALPGGHAAPDVREPGGDGRSAPRRCSRSGRSTRRSPYSIDPATIAAKRTDWIKEWTDLVVR